MPTTVAVMPFFRLAVAAASIAASWSAVKPVAGAADGAAEGAADGAAVVGAAGAQAVSASPHATAAGTMRRSRVMAVPPELGGRWDRPCRATRRR